MAMNTDKQKHPNPLSLSVTPDKGLYAPGEDAVMNVTLTLAEEAEVEGGWTVYRLNRPVAEGRLEPAAYPAGTSALAITLAELGGGCEAYGFKVQAVVCGNRNGLVDASGDKEGPQNVADEKDRWQNAGGDSDGRQDVAGDNVGLRAAAEGEHDRRKEADGEHNRQQAEAETAFDFAAHWREAPRYGFLSDFAPEDGGDNSDVDYLSRHHINIVQYYDWMYRHDRLLPDEDTFRDPMGKISSLAVIREKMDALKSRGIASIAYAAVYGGLKDYADAHPEQVLYQADGRSYNLIDLFHIMDISPDSAWTEHIIQEFAKVIAYGFDGLHLDQYGFPKKAIRRKDGREEVVALKELYPTFINQVRAAVAPLNPEAGLIFNNVSNYPPQTTARAEQDIIYIEVWDPVSSLGHLKPVIDRARELSGKQVVLAAYLPSFNPHNPLDQTEAEIGAQMAMAAIFASGGYHLLLGEHENILTQAYYPDYGTVSPAFKETLRHYYDFIVMYRDLLFDHALDDISLTYSGGINQEITFRKEGVVFDPHQGVGKVWTLIKEKPGHTVLQLLNQTGVDNDIWHAPKKQAPTAVAEVVCTMEMLEEVEAVYAASPDGTSILPQPLDYVWVKGAEGRPAIQFVIPTLAYWTMVNVQTRRGVPAPRMG
jgi:dextranase